MRSRSDSQHACEDQAAKTRRKNRLRAKRASSQPRPPTPPTGEPQPARQVADLMPARRSGCNHCRRRIRIHRRHQFQVRNLHADVVMRFSKPNEPAMPQQPASNTVTSKPGVSFNASAVPFDPTSASDGNAGAKSPYPHAREYSMTTRCHSLASPASCRPFPQPPQLAWPPVRHQLRPLVAQRQNATPVPGRESALRHSRSASSLATPS